jgi:ABC-type multidrug transport system ATPase subunit
LACAAIGDSELIFLDEPSSGMDPNTRRNIWGMIEQLKEEGKTIVLTTHHLEEA